LKPTRIAKPPTISTIVATQADKAGESDHSLNV